MKHKKLYLLMAAVICIGIITSCGTASNTSYNNNENKSVDEDNRSIILNNDYTNEKRNQLLKEDIEFLGKELPKKHKNMFRHISRKEFDNQLIHLINRVNRLNNEEVFVEMNKIIAQIGDAHTNIGYLDGYIYPVKFYVFDDGIYVINADKNFEDIVYSKVVAVNGIDIGYVTEQLETLISHENDNWVSELIPTYLTMPIFMYGLGLIPDEKETVFSFEKSDREIVERHIPVVKYEDNIDYCILYDKERNVYDSDNEDNYWYEYLPEKNTLYFKYNICYDMDKLPFSEFNKNMFDEVKDYKINKIVIDLRHNAGGSDMIIKPFLIDLKEFNSKNRDTEIFIIASRSTFSSGIIGVLDIKETVPSSILVGEATGGSPNGFGEILNFELPNSKIPIYYSTKLIWLTDGIEKTILPDVELSPTINDFKENNDVFMNYIFNEKIGKPGSKITGN